MSIKTKYTTLVFKSETKEGHNIVGKYAQSDLCRAWSLDHEILRLELIEKALDENDIEKAKSYISQVDVAQFESDLQS